MNKKKKNLSHIRNMDRKQEFLSRVSETTMIPDDIVSDSCCITVTGQNELVIENYKSILEYHSEKLVVLARPCRIEICGKRLEIIYYAREEMKIKGKIECITYKK